LTKAWQDSPQAWSIPGSFRSQVNPILNLCL
jgi:hypothetical protein